jgi:hypothetical protein
MLKQTSGMATPPKRISRNVTTCWPISGHPIVCGAISAAQPNQKNNLLNTTENVHLLNLRQVLPRLP